MAIYGSMWGMWTQLFSTIPYGDPWVASFAAVFAMMAAGKVVKTVMEYT